MFHSFHCLIKYAALTSLLGCYSYHVNAYVILPTNRIIINEKEKTKSIELINKSKISHLVQLRVKPYSDKGTEKESDINLPFFITPPLFVLQGEQKQKVRITLTKKSELPTDRESLFSFNFLEVPSEQAIETSSQMKYTIDNSVKLFYRPKGIKGHPKDLSKSLILRQQSKAGKSYLSIDNQTGYYANIEHIMLFISGKHILLKDYLMIEPYSKTELLLPKSNYSLNHPKVQYKLINDYGGRDEYTTEFTYNK